MIQLYAITDHPGPPLPPDAGLRAVTCRGLALLCTTGEEAVDPTPEHLWRHEELVEALMEERDLLPVRYGTRLDDESAAARVLHERHGEFAEALDRVRGAVEVSVRVLGPPDEQPAPDEPVTGTEYIRAKARDAAAESAIAEAVHRPLSELARASIRRPGGQAGELMRGAYLVDRAAFRDFVAHVVELEQSRPDLRLLCTGPWPPYSFTES